MIQASDWGSYLGPTGNIILPFKRLKEQGVECWIFKGGQEVDTPTQKISTTKNMAAARAEGVSLVGCYYWNDPLVSAQNQIDTYSRLIDAEKPDFIGIDIEQWWASWSAYMAYVNGTAPMSSVPVRESAGDQRERAVGVLWDKPALSGHAPAALYQQGICDRLSLADLHLAGDLRGPLGRKLAGLWDRSAVRELGGAAGIPAGGIPAGAAGALVQLDDLADQLEDKASGVQRDDLRPPVRLGPDEFLDDR
jgi:hypothetical protein